MPRIPTVGAPEDSSTPLSNARVTGNGQRRQAVLAPTVRANPNMRAGEFGAMQQLGGAVENTGELLFKIKNATDSAYITRSQTTMQAAQADFQNWTQTNPNPSTWSGELDARLKAVKEDVTAGAKGLSKMAKQRLGLVLNDFEVGTRKRVQLQATEQNLQIAQASYQDFIAQAVGNNDLAGIEAKVTEGIGNGIFSAKTGHGIVTKARQQITANLANALIETDPFEARRQLEAKDDAGNFLNFPELQPAARENLLLYRVAKAESIERTQATRAWSQMIGEAREGKGPMPDEEGVRKEAERMGIAKTTVDKWFKPPTATKPEEFARSYVEISTYDADQDPTGRRMGELVAQIETFKGPARERLDALLTKKLKPDDTLNNPIAKFGVSSIKDMFEIGGYGQFKAPPSYDPQTGDKVAGAEIPAAKQKAEVIMARNMDLFQTWLKSHPEASYEEAQKYINSLNAEHATNSASRLIINAGAFGFGR